MGFMLAACWEVSATDIQRVIDKYSEQPNNSEFLSLTTREKEIVAFLDTVLPPVKDGEESTVDVLLGSL